MEWTGYVRSTQLFKKWYYGSNLVGKISWSLKPTFTSFTADVKNMFRFISSQIINLSRVVITQFTSDVILSILAGNIAGTRQRNA
jgi:hypothetical protein